MKPEELLADANLVELLRAYRAARTRHAQAQREAPDDPDTAKLQRESLRAGNRAARHLIKSGAADTPVRARQLMTQLIFRLPRE
ncbi:MAG TPA: hypothetical protein VHL09_15315 [Dehalococcoidia bacterium]|nr:hypothetical protein [Dehalococcoidia bacterium]